MSLYRLARPLLFSLDEETSHHLALRTAGMPQRIALRLHPLAIERGDRPEPRDGAEARLSAQHCAAVALLYGAAGMEQFTDRVVADPEVRSLRARVTITADERLDKAAVVVDIDGREKHAELRPTMSDGELEAKVRSSLTLHSPERSSVCAVKMVKRRAKGVCRQRFPICPPENIQSLRVVGTG